jgi:uncharacterized membrane protein YdjX (TVP38/TMEM64 family)
MEKKKIVEASIKTFILAVIIGLIIYFSIRYWADLMKILKNQDTFKEFLLSYGKKSILIFILFQILQVIIAVIPGEVVQIAGGYVFGTVFGTLYSISGIVIGSIIVFFIGRIFGYSLIKIFVPEKQIEKFNHLINDKKSEIMMFLLFLIPGIPKDFLTYIAGLTPVKPLRFFLIISIARLPALVGSSYIGENIQTQNFIPVIIVGAIAVILFISGVIFQEKIINFIHKLTNKEEKNS